MAAPPTAQTPRGHARWLAFAAVIVPLAILLLLQFRTLARLQEASTAAYQLALKGYARTVLRSAEAFFRLKVDDALQVPVELLDAAQRDALAAYFAGRDSRGVKRFFVIPFAAGAEAALFFGPDGRPIDTSRDAAETRAARFAAAPWELTAREATEVVSPPPAVDEQDPDNRVILRPIVGADSHVRGVVGLILDTAYFRDHYVPELLQAENALIPAPLRDHVVVSVAQRPGGSVPTHPASADIDAPFRFVFTDWRLSVRNPTLAPAQWERWSFLTNLAVSLGLGAVLLGAVLLALRSAARATELSQMKTEFVSSVSHELRTPLASIRVFGEFLRLGRVSGPEKVREYGEYIEAESRRLTQLVNNILDFSKIESGQKRYQLERADVAEIVAETLRTFEVRLKQDGFVVDLHASPAPLPPAWVDPPAIGQVLTNLLDNAIKYSGDARRIGVTLGRQNGFVTLAVTDEGPGIPIAEQERIFDKFYRVGYGLVHDAKGSGLGLAIVKHIVEAHRGRVVVDSRPGSGSTFTVELPIHGG